MFIATHLIGFGASSEPNEILFTRTTNSTVGLNVYTLMGSPSTVGTYRFIIASGVEISSNSTATPGLTVGNFPAGSTVIIENNGTIKGAGGAGGSSTTGGAGGNAISLATGYTVRIDNTSGNIWGGGGGGGRGQGRVLQGDDSYSYYANGGSGGKGAGPSAAVSGSAGQYVVQGANFGQGGTGGAGGGYGAVGSTGGSGSGTVSKTYVWYAASAGGAAGKAINLNGNTVTWLGGNNASQVKGAVS